MNFLFINTSILKVNMVTCEKKDGVEEWDYLDFLAVIPDRVPELTPMNPEKKELNDFSRY